MSTTMKRRSFIKTSSAYGAGVLIAPNLGWSAGSSPNNKLNMAVPGHSGDWVRSIKDSTAPKPSCNFDYSARLTEIVLLGTVALKAGGKLVYDMKKGQFTNNRPDANALLKREPRRGWTFGYEG